MIRCVLLASFALHVGLMAVLPNARPATARPPAPLSIVEVASEPPPPPKEEPPPPPEPLTMNPPPVMARTAAPTRTTSAPSTVSPSSATNDVGSVPSVDGDGPADFTGTVISNAAPGAASKIVVSAAPFPPSPPAEPKVVPVSSLSRRPGAPGLDAELERNYPIDARRAGISGTAKLRVRILADGRVGKVERILESHPGFGDACTKTVRAARWEPPLDAEGRAVATEIVYVCKFEVRS